MSNGAEEIRWASRVPKRKIRELYDSEASGLVDGDLLDDVGISLYLRCESILAVGQAQRGQVLGMSACPPPTDGQTCELLRPRGTGTARSRGQILK